MPGFVTHYIFGREAYSRMGCRPYKRNLYGNRAAYGLGLQGPDLFFYLLSSYPLRGYNLGSLAHEKNTGAFFEGLIRSCLSFRQGADRAVAEAYLAGFLGHYILDTICHPYIYAMTRYAGPQREYFCRHAYLETDIDEALLALKLHRTPGSFRNNGTIALDRRQKRVISVMLRDAFHHAYPQIAICQGTVRLAIFSIRLGMRLLRDRTGQKKVLFRFLEHHLLGYPVFSPLIPSEDLFFRTDPFNLRHAAWQNPWNPSLESKESFFDLYEKAMRRYLLRLDGLFLALPGKWDGSRLQREQLAGFMRGYGNRSFHSGLDIAGE